MHPCATCISHSWFVCPLNRFRSLQILTRATAHLVRTEPRAHASATRHILARASLGSQVACVVQVSTICCHIQILILSLIYPLTARVVGAPQMILQPVSSNGESLAKYNLTEPIPLQVEHVAVEFIVEPFRQIRDKISRLLTCARNFERTWSKIMDWTASFLSVEPNQDEIKVCRWNAKLRFYFQILTSVPVPRVWTVVDV